MFSFVFGIVFGKRPALIRKYSGVISGSIWAPMGSNGLQWGKMGKQSYAFFCFLFYHSYGKYVQIIGLRAPGNYSDQFWLDKISISLCEGPKPPNSMIS